MTLLSLIVILFLYQQQSMGLPCGPACVPPDYYCTKQGTQCSQFYCTTNDTCRQDVANSYCDPSRICIPPDCDTTTDCPRGFICDRDKKCKFSVNDCNLDGTCSSANLYCAVVSCFPRYCTRDSDCNRNLYSQFVYCDPVGHICTRMTCTSDAYCPPNYTCNTFTERCESPLAGNTTTTTAPPSPPTTTTVPGNNSGISSNIAPIFGGIYIGILVGAIIFYGIYLIYTTNAVNKKKKREEEEAAGEPGYSRYNQRSFFGSRKNK